jgi:hypothetical protein
MRRTDARDHEPSQGADPPVVPPGWIVTDPTAGKLRRRPAGPAQQDGQHDTADPQIANDN